MVIDKPSGVAVHGGSGVSHGVIESLRAERPQARFLELAHRLDRDTSGLLIVAKKRSALTALHAMLREGAVEKIYLAVAKGIPAKPSFDISESLHKYVTSQGERRVAVREDGKASTTRVRVVKSGESFSLLELMQQLEKDSTEVLMIGDTSHDLEMANAAGVDSLAVTYGAHREEGLRACSPRGCISTVEELSGWLTANA